MQYNQVPIRLEADLVSAPPVNPIDANTGNAPEAWRRQDIAVQVGIFDASQVPVDLSNLTYLQLVLQEASDSLVPSVVKTLAQVNLVPIITRGGWDDGTEQQAIFALTAADMDLGLDGQPSKTYWIIIQGLTQGGQQIVYAAGSFEIFNAGSFLPQPPFGYVSENDQTNAGGNSTIAPSTQLHTEVITFSGVAGTRNLVVGSAGLTKGARVIVLALLPATTGIMVQLWNQTIGGSALFSIVTDGYLRQACFELYYDGFNFHPLRATVPAF